MDKLARTESSPRRMNRDERPVHPCTRDLVFSLATCGSLFILGSWSLTAVGCSAQAKTNEQRTAQRRNATPNNTTNPSSSVNSHEFAQAPMQPNFGPTRVTAATASSGKFAQAALAAMPNGAFAVNTKQNSPNNPSAQPSKAPMLMTAATPQTTGAQPSMALSSAFTKQKYLVTDRMMALRPTPANTASTWVRTNTTYAGTAPNTNNRGSALGNAQQMYASTKAFANTNTNTNTNTTTQNNGNTTELSRMLADAFAQNTKGSMDPMRVWFIYASLAVSNPEIKLPEGWNQDLVPSERDRVLAAHAGFVALGKSFRDGATNVDSATRQALVAALTGEPALTIPRVDLCSKITGFGEYSPISRRNFLQGSDTRVIVYSELDGFKSHLENGKWTTRLSTRVSIVPTNGATNVAWCRTPEWTEVVDVADNRRQQFFLGEIIPIGSSLAMGNYNVKVEVKDLTTGAVTQSIIPFKVLDKQAFAAASERGDTN